MKYICNSLNHRTSRLCYYSYARVKRARRHNGPCRMKTDCVVVITIVKNLMKPQYNIIGVILESRAIAITGCIQMVIVFVFGFRLDSTLSIHVCTRDTLAHNTNEQFPHNHFSVVMINSQSKSYMVSTDCIFITKYLHKLIYNEFK